MLKRSILINKSFTWNTESGQIIRNGLKRQDVAYDRSKMVKQVGHVVMIMTSSLSYIQQIWTTARNRG